MSYYLRTERLVLRPFTLVDLAELVALDGDPEVMRFITAGQPTPMERLRDEVLPRFLQAYDGPHATLSRWAAVDRASERFLGWFHFHPFEGSLHEIEFGYRLRRDAWGQGLATEGSKALLARGFLELDVPRVIARAMKANRASIQVMKKSGLRFLGHYLELRFPGVDRRAVRYGMTRDEYLRAKQQRL